MAKKFGHPPVEVLNLVLQARRVSMVRFNTSQLLNGGEIGSSTLENLEGPLFHDIEVAVGKMPPRTDWIEFYTATVIVGITEDGEIEIAREDGRPSIRYYINPRIVEEGELQTIYGVNADTYRERLESLGEGTQMILPAGSEPCRDSQLIFVRPANEKIKLHFT